MALSILFMFMSVATSLADAMLAMYCFQQKNGGRDLGITCIGCCITGLTYMLSVLPIGYRLASVFASLYFVSIDMLLWFLIGFAVQYTHLNDKRFIQLTRKLLMVLCIIDSFFMLINPFTEIAISYSYRGTTIAPYAYEMKPLYDMHLIICYVMVVIVLALFIYKSITTPRDYRKQYLISVLGIVLVVAYNAMFLFLPDKTVLNFLDYSIWGYSFAAFFIYWNAYSYSQHGMLNHFRSWIFDNISQGLVLFDFENKRMTHNERAESMLPANALAEDVTMEEFIQACHLPVMSTNLTQSVTFQSYIPNSDLIVPVRCDIRVMKDKAGRSIMGHLFVFTETSNEQDLLTGFHNWESFRHTLYDKARPYNSNAVLVAACDINGLQSINDTRGRQVGDQAIRLMSDAMRRYFPKSTYFVRGREATLLAICYDTTEDEVRECLTKIASSVNENSNLDCFINIQYAISPSANGNLEKAIMEAFRGLRAKKMLDRHSSHSELISSLVQALQETDNDTEAHVVRTQKIGAALGARLKLSDIQMSDLSLLCILHDIGKIGIPLEILNKPGKLTPEEWTVLQSHVEKGYQICIASKELHSIAQMVRHHHERWDGTGYPDGLSKESIPLLSRVIAIVDSFDAMVNNRSYRKALTVEAALDELRRGAGTQFDPGIVSEFLDLLSEQEGLYVPAAPQNEDEAANHLPDTMIPLSRAARTTDDIKHVHRITHGQYVTDANSNILSANKGFEELTGYTQQDIENGMNQIDLICLEDRAEYMCALTEQLAHSPFAYLEHRLLCKDGTTKYVFCYGRDYFDSVARANRTEIVIVDSSNSNAVRTLISEERSRAQLRLNRWEKKYRTDSLTGLLSHEAFRNDVDMRLLRSDTRCMFVMMDVDHFKQYNDRFGHAIGDEFLIRVAQTISSTLRRDDLACRMGGDEFAVALFFPADTDIQSLHARARAICDQVNEYLQASGSGTSISMGSAISTRKLHNFNMLYEAADRALYAAKDQGRARIVQPEPVDL